MNFIYQFFISFREQDVKEDMYMYFVTKNADRSSAYVTELVADTDADVKDIPVDLYDPGTTCIVIDNSTVYMLNTQKEWKLL